MASLLGGEFLFYALDFWPRNEIKFTGGIAVHSAEFLRQVAVRPGTGSGWRRAP